MKISKTLELIGKTPLVEIVQLNQGFESHVYAKLESFNPMGSIKDRVALEMITAAEKSGLLKKGMIIIEPTSGNTGIALAYIGTLKGYSVLLTMPESMSLERRNLLKALGARLILTPAQQGMQGAIDKAKQLLEENGEAFMPDQFNNPANPVSHYKTTAPEIWQQLSGKIDVFVAGVGTGGTISGVGKYLKQQNPQVEIIAVEPLSSAVLSGGSAGSHKIQGIGAGFVPGNLDKSSYDRVIAVAENDAFDITKKLAIKESLFVGISSGANMFVSLQLAQMPEYKNKNIVTIMCDTGARYLSAGVFD